MAGTSNIAPAAPAGAGSTGNALTNHNGTLEPKPVASAADPALASRFGNISKLSVPLPVLGIAVAINPGQLTGYVGDRKSPGAGA
jgi:hypothetical protein